MEAVSTEPHATEPIENFGLRVISQREMGVVKEQRPWGVSTYSATRIMPGADGYQVETLIMSDSRRDIGSYGLIDLDTGQPVVHYKNMQLTDATHLRSLGESSAHKIAVIKFGLPTNKTGYFYIETSDGISATAVNEFGKWVRENPDMTLSSSELSQQLAQLMRFEDDDISVGIARIRGRMT